MCVSIVLLYYYKYFFVCVCFCVCFMWYHCADLLWFLLLANTTTTTNDTYSILYKGESLSSFLIVKLIFFLKNHLTHDFEYVLTLPSVLLSRPKKWSWKYFVYIYVCICYKSQFLIPAVLPTCFAASQLKLNISCTWTRKITRYSDFGD